MEKASAHGRPSPREAVRHFPTEAGVYLMKDASGAIIYVGKAKQLRNRVRSYFSKDKDVKTTALMKRVDSIDYVVCRNEYEALLLENNLIKEHSPRYNINLKDGKTYPVIRVTNEEYPRVFRTRRIVNDGSRYYGPYANVQQIDRYLELIEKLFPLRKCRGPLKKREHPCLYYHIGRCAGVCAGRTTHEEYRSRVRSIESILSGRVKMLVARLRREMKTAGAELEFERAAELRDAIAAIEMANEEQQVVDFELDSRDYLGVYRRHTRVSFAILHMRGGKLLGTDLYHLDAIGEDEDVIPQFLMQYYAEARTLPERLVIGIDSRTVEAIASSLSEYFASEMKRPVGIQSPESARDASVIGLAEDNARRDFEKRSRERGNQPALEELQRILALPSLPKRIEGFDIAQVAGTHPVASMVSFRNGRPDKSEYRRYHMKTLKGKIDDFAAMREVVARRYTRVANEDLPRPDLILIDGGKGQVNAAVNMLRALELDIPVLGLAKREEEVFLPGRSDPIILPEGSDPLRILQAVRDEAHRFATTFRATLQGKDITRSLLESVDGIGPARSRRLLERFASLAAIAEADAQMIAAEGGISLEVARRVKGALQPDGTGSDTDATRAAGTQEPEDSDATSD
jgi:excinuclease ABC subunit C